LLRWGLLSPRGRREDEALSIVYPGQVEAQHEGGVQVRSYTTRGWRVRVEDLTTRPIAWL